MVAKKKLRYFLLVYNNEIPGPQPGAIALSHQKRPKYLGREFNHGHYLSHNFFLATALDMFSITNPKHSE